MSESGLESQQFEVKALFSSPSRVAGEVLVLEEPLSFWGGFDLETGSICDQNHPQVGTVLTNKVLVLRSGRGSSSASSVLAESIRSGVGPCAILMKDPDAILALGSIVAAELYDLYCPVAVVDEENWQSLLNAKQVAIEVLTQDDQVILQLLN